MSAPLFQLPKAQALNASANPVANAELYFFAAGTSTPQNTYTDSALAVPHTHPVAASASGVFPPIFLDPDLIYKVDLRTPAGVSFTGYPVDDVAPLRVTRATVAEILTPRTTQEIAAGVTPSDYFYPPGNVLRYGADNTGAASSTSAIQAAINTGHDVTFPAGSYLAQGLTQTLDFQRFKAEGNVRVIKNANGPILTCAGDDVELNGIGFRGDAASPTYTGDGVVISGDNPRVYNCGVRWISGIPLLATGAAAQIDGTCDIYQTTDAGGYDIVVGVSGTATLYHRVKGIRTSQATGGIKLIDTGSAVVSDSQFGKLFVDAGTSPAGVNGGNFTGNRILGAVSVELSSATFAGNTFGAVTITFGAGTSGHSLDDSNTLASGAAITDNSTGSNIVDLRQVPPQSYTPAWTAASVNPALGNGTLIGLASKRGRVVTVQLRLIAGSTTTFGTGEWYISLPYIPSTTLPAVGSVHVVDSGTTNYRGVCETLTDGTARMVFYTDASTSYRDTVPHTWANGDELSATISYFV